MTSNFEETSISRNAKRTYNKIADLETFEETLAAFAADQTMGLTKRERSNETYKARIDYFDADANDKGYLTFTATDKDQFESFTPYLAGNETAETAAGIGASASRDEDEDAWSIRYSCAIGDDTFNVTITREYMLISGFAKDETLAAVEAWADTQTALGGTAA